MPRFARKHGVRVHGISDRCLAVPAIPSWPGNVRELQNVIERAVILCGDTGLFEPEHLGFSASAATERRRARAVPSSRRCRAAPGRRRRRI